MPQLAEKQSLLRLLGQVGTHPSLLIPDPPACIREQIVCAGVARARSCGVGRVRSWGILVATTAGLDEVHHHLRTLTRVVLPGRQPALFRFWDPRVLRDWLPTCDGAQLERMFGPIARFHAESEDGAATLTFVLNGGTLVAL